MNAMTEGVNELIAHLRAQAVQLRYRGMIYVADLLTAAADALESADSALEAAQAELGELVLLGSLREAELVDALAERDAEAALADQLMCDLEWLAWAAQEEDVLSLLAGPAAHRERRTTPTKDGER